MQVDENNIVLKNKLKTNIIKIMNIISTPAIDEKQSSCSKENTR